MSDHSKKYENLNEMFVAVQAMNKFQSIHNVIRKDYIVLLKTTGGNISTVVTFDALYRASLRSLFSLIEADIYALNKLDQYSGYADRDTFNDKFKKTFTQIATTWKKEAIKNEYFDSNLKELKELKKMRDELVHPKEIAHIHKASESDFQKLKKVFNEYDTFINDLMNNFFLNSTVSFS